MRFTIDPQLVIGITEGKVDGFYRLVANEAPRIEY